MHLTSDIKFKKLVVIGDRVLIRPSRPHERTDSGLYLLRACRRKKKYSKAMSSRPDLVMQFPCR
jgi:chaperonin GroES